MWRGLTFVVAVVLLFAFVQSQATTQSSAKVYVVADITVHDPATFGQYRHQVADIIREFGGRYLIRAGNLQFDGESGDTVTATGGDWNPDRFIVLEYDSEEEVRVFFESEEYLKVSSLRTGSATTRGIIVNGYNPTSN